MCIDLHIYISNKYVHQISMNHYHINLGFQDADTLSELVLTGLKTGNVYVYVCLYLICLDTLARKIS